MTEQSKITFDQIDRQHLEFITEEGPVVVNMVISHNDQANLFQLEGKIQAGKKGEKRFELVLAGQTRQRTSTNGRENHFRFDKVAPGDYILQVKYINNSLEIGLTL